MYIYIYIYTMQVNIEFGIWHLSEPVYLVYLSGYCHLIQFEI